MKTLLQLTVVLFAGMAISAHAQNRYWVIPPNYVDFYTGQVLPLPNTAIAPATTVDFIDLVAGSSGTISGVPLNKGTDYTYQGLQPGLRVANGLFDQSGVLQYYLNNRAYVTFGKTVIYKNGYEDVLPILPVPQTCDYFYLIEGTNFVASDLFISYKKISKNGSVITSNSVLVPDERFLLNQFTASALQYDEQTATSSYRLYALGDTYLYEYIVSPSGISFVRRYFHSDRWGIRETTELEVSPNGRYVAWTYPRGIYSSELVIKVIDLQTSTLYVYQGGDAYADPAVGIEFSESSDKIFFCVTVWDEAASAMNTINKIGYFSLGSGSPYTYYSSPTISIPGYYLGVDDIGYVPNSQNLSGSFIEKAVDGYMYVSDGSNLHGFNPDNPGAGILKTILVSNPLSIRARSPSFLVAIPYYTLPDQIDGVDHTNIFQIGCELTKTISNVTSSNGSLSPIAKVSQTIETGGTVTVAANTSVTFKAGDQILLKPGFTVAAGGNFRGGLEYCDDFVIDYCSGVGSREAKAETPAIEVKNGEVLINVYPNTTTGLVTINTSNSIIRSVEVVSLNGSRILSLAPVSTETQVDLSPFASGVYVVRITHEKGIETRKVILVK